MTRDGQINGVIQSIYESSSGLISLQSTLEAMCSLFNAEFAIFLGINTLELTDGEMLAALNVGPEQIDDYNEHFAPLNILMQRGTEGLLKNRVAFTSEYVSDTEISKTEFYNDWMRPQGIFYSGGMLVNTEDAWIDSLIMARGWAGNDFDRDDYKVMQVLRPHMETAMRVMRRLNHLNAYANAWEETADASAMGIILLDQDTRVVSMNRTAERLLKGNDGLSYRNSRVFARAQCSEFLQAQRNAVASAGTGTQLRIPRKAKLDIEVILMPLTGHESALVTRRPVAAAMFLHDPLWPKESQVRKWAAQYDLTVRELDVLEGLIAGKPTAEIAESMSIKHASVQTYTKNLIRKTGAKSQREVVARLLSEIPPLHFK